MIWSNELVRVSTLAYVHTRRVGYWRNLWVQSDVNAWPTVSWKAVEVV
jgi:hypothetical protein